MSPLSTTTNARDLTTGPPHKPAVTDGSTQPRIDSRAWFAQHRVIEIDHHGTIYRLRCTSQGKLILTK